MKKGLFLLYLSILLISITFVSAGPMRNITIHVEDATGANVDNAHVHMYVNNSEYYDFSGLTDENGYITFEVDARINVAVNNTIPYTRGTKPALGQAKIAEIENNREIYYSLYRNKTFHFEIISTGISIGFGNIHENYSLKLNQDYEFNFTVINDLYVYPFPSYYINEFNSSKIIIDFDDYVITSGGFDELIIMFDIEFSDIDAYFNYDNETHEMEVNFFPEINLDYHINNEIQIELIIESDNEIYEQVFYYTYIPDCRAMIGHIKDHYTNELIYNSQLNSSTYVGELMFENNNSVFLGFYVYGNDNDPIYITKDNYIPSERSMIILGGDQTINFTLIPELFNGSTLHNDLFDQLFRWDNSGTVRQSEYYGDLNTYSICTAGFNGYNVSNDELEKVNVSLNNIAQFTANYHRPFEGYLEYRNTQEDCLAIQNQMYYILVLWNGSMDPDESIIEYLYWGNRIYGATIKFGGNEQSIITQKIIQSISTPNTQTELNNSIFSNAGIEELSQLDYNWGKRLYMRRAKNMAPDTDWELFDREDYAIKLTTATYSGTESHIETKIIGYAKDEEDLKNIELVSKNNIYSNAIMNKYKLNNFFELSNNYKISKEQINKIEYLFKEK